MTGEDVLEPFRRSPRRGVFLDFDGTLAEIVARPELARPLPEVRSVLARLVGGHDLVAVVSGRRSEDVVAMLDVRGVYVFGHYGLEAAGAPAVRDPAVRTEVEGVVGQVKGAWVEDKEGSLAVHYRAAPDPVSAERVLGAELGEIAKSRGLTVLPGKMVLELAPSDTPGKGEIVLRQARDRGLTACLYAGDDVADLAAFAALDELRAGGAVTTKVAVRSEETPQALLDEADLVVERPAGLLELLARL